ncbi:MAG: TrkA family potassium uptake protein [Methanomicrobiales archaeon]|nr:TrkA family potassium uptake protein [Methanomicrobiales archaeon]
MNIIIFGCGRMGSGLAHRLVQSHHTITIIDHDPKAFERLGTSYTGKTIIRDALDRESFHESGIERADGVAAVTGNDAVNIVVARAARQMYRVPKVIARTHDPRYADIYHKLGIETVTNVALGIERISEMLTFSHLDIIHGLGNNEVGIVKYEIHPTLAGHQVKDLTIPGEIIIISLTRRGKTMIPTLGATFEKGDVIYLAVEEQSVDKLKELMMVTGGG